MMIHFFSSFSCTNLQLPYGACHSKAQLKTFTCLHFLLFIHDQQRPIYETNVRRDPSHPKQFLLETKLKFLFWMFKKNIQVAPTNRFIK